MSVQRLSGFRPAAMDAASSGLGRCAACFWLAVVFDAVGLVVLLVGVFANVFFYDLLIYAGAIVIFLSLVWWVFWYSGNIEVPPAELEDDVGLQKKERGGLAGLSGAVRRLSGRVSGSIRRSLRRTEAPGPARGSAALSDPMAVPMETIPPLQRGPHETSCVQMPRTATETSPT